VVILLDGDGAIFNDDLIAKGRDGGHKAAIRLRESIVSHLHDTLGDTGYLIWVFGFLNKRGLSSVLNSVSLNGGKLHEFVSGSNQSNDRFILLDVGEIKEAADVKLRGLST
ncbi:hypothetical protein HDZ31DRAFT_5110, partial [Schizophyllum fasciatum]